MDGWTVQWRMVVKPDLKSKRGDCQWMFLGGRGEVECFLYFLYSLADTHTWVVFHEMPKEGIW